MGDVFKEQLIKKHSTFKDFILKALIGLGFIIAVAATMLAFQQLLPIIILVMGFLVFYLYGLLNKEFEYIFTNGELDIDCIYGKARRKRKFTCNIKDARFLAHANNREAEVELKKITESLNFGSGRVNENTWYLLVSHQGKHVKMIFEPNEAMFNAIRTYIGPRKIYKKL